MNFGVLVSLDFFDDCVGCFDFSGVDDECEIEYFLRSALGASYKERKSRWRACHFYGSNRQEEGEAHSWRYSNNNNNRGGSSWRQRVDQEEEKEEEEDKQSSTEVNDLDSSEQSHRKTLGLSSSGPLTLGDVKNAYRVCALKWHPDLHHDSTKDAAEEKFKLCSVAYESLCEKFAMK
uniref:J domain-containing protein n=1 Tax=Brassica campestris TaxID=3711 RepID=M4CT32_BRACM